MPLLLSILNQELDQQALKGFLALAGHRPTIMFGIKVNAEYIITKKINSDIRVHN